jgi:hypothetical protein
MELTLQLKSFSEALPSTNGSILVRYKHGHYWDVLDWHGWTWQTGELHYSDDDLVEKFSEWARLPAKEARK